MLKRSGKRGHPCFVTDLGGKASSFSPLSMMLVIGFHSLYIAEKIPLYSKFTEFLP